MNQKEVFAKKLILWSISHVKKMVGNKVFVSRKHCQFLLEMIFVGATSRRPSNPFDKRIYFSFLRIFWKQVFRNGQIVHLLRYLAFLKMKWLFSFILGLSLYVTKSFFFLTCYKKYGITKPFLWNYWKTMAEKLSMQESEISEDGWFEYLKNHMIITFDKNA